MTYIEAAELREVAYEQFAFLVCHAGLRACPDRCPECQRLNRVMAMLVGRPFRVKRHAVTPLKRQAKAKRVLLLAPPAAK